MRKRIKAVLAPVVIVAAIAGAAGYRAQGSGSASRLDELSTERPAAATFPIDGALLAASQVAAEKQYSEYIEAVQRNQLEAFFQAVLAAETEKAAAARTPQRAAPTGRGGGGGTVSGACGGATNGADRFIGAESGGNPNARNPSGAWGCYQIMPGTWRGSCSDLGQHGSASTDAQAQCASRLPSSSWAATGG